MTKLIEQTIIAQKLGISNKAMRRIAQSAKLKFKLIDNKRHYKWKDFVEAITFVGKLEREKGDRRET
ncbi:MAG: hypothetical protein ABIF08_00230 [Nanoarchaeota archaeon]